MNNSDEFVVHKFVSGKKLNMKDFSLVVEVVVDEIGEMVFVCPSISG